MLRPLAALTLLAALALAGCAKESGGGTPTEDECELEPALCDPEAFLATHHCIVNDVRPRIYAPDTPGPDSETDPWVLGDYWDYTLTLNGEQRDGMLVYYEDIDELAGKFQHYLVGTPSREDALEHALFSVNPMLGRIHRSLYSPHESGVHVDMFNFPLCEGSAWNTAFYGRDFSMTAHSKPVSVPGASQYPNGFEITGTSQDGSRLRLTYSPVVKWFTELDLNRADGLALTMELGSYGSGKTGRYEFLRAQKDQTIDLSKVVDGTNLPREDGGEGPYDVLALYLEVERTAGTGKVEVHLKDPAGTSRACVGIAGSGLAQETTCPAGPLQVEIPYQEGTWRLTVEKLIIDTTTKVAGEALIVSIYDRGGNV